MQEIYCFSVVVGRCTDTLMQRNFQCIGFSTELVWKFVTTFLCQFVQAWPAQPTIPLSLQLSANGAVCLGGAGVAGGFSWLADGQEFIADGIGDNVIML